MKNIFRGESKMTSSRQLFIRLAIIVIVWYVGLSYLPQIVGTCFDGECGFSLGEIIVSLAVPLAFIALPVVLEMILYHKGLSGALSDIGITRFNWTGIRIAAVYLLPVIVYYPLFSILAQTPLVAQPNWQWRIVNVLLVNGLAEEIMMRGFVFRHIREGRPFWRAAGLATAYFAAYHIVLLFTAGVVIGIIAVIIAIPTGFLTAYIYERGRNTIWGSALLHAVYNAFALIFIFPTDLQPIASLLYLLLGSVIAITMLVWVYRSGYERSGAQAIPQPRIGTT
jgi:membrane protease YdiL (CAAX protease family)